MFFISPVIYFYAYADETDGKTCVVGLYVVRVFLNQLGALRIQNLHRTHVETLCFPVWLHLSSRF
jgi:hypothetical protein